MTAEIPALPGVSGAALQSGGLRIFSPVVVFWAFRWYTTPNQFHWKCDDEAVCRTLGPRDAMVGANRDPWRQVHFRAGRSNADPVAAVICAKVGQ